MVPMAWESMQRAVRLSVRAPLSARLALHAAVLIDQMSDIVFSERRLLPLLELETLSDFLAFRASLRAIEPSLGLIMDLTSFGPASPRLEVLATKVAPEEFSGLAVADLMVSLYNSGTVPRLKLVQRDGRRQEMQDVLQAATDWWGKVLGMSV